MSHIPVLQKEVLEYLNPKANENFIDCTIGEGGHTVAILERNKPNGKVLGIEIDPELYQEIRNRMMEVSGFKFQVSDRLILVNSSYTNLKEIVEESKFWPVHGVLLDLGMSSWHLGKSGRGFTFLKDEPLDMKYNTKSPGRGADSPKGCISNVPEGVASRRPYGAGKCQKNDYLTAEKIVNEYSQNELERILKDYGEEKFSERIAKEIIKERKIKPIKTTFRLIEVLKKAIPLKYHHQRIHFATRTFQALRIAVNDELNNLKKVLPQILEVLSPGGRIAIISFHSLEDRIIKIFFKSLSSIKLKILTKKPITAAKQEIIVNPRCRSAKLRAAMKI